MTIDDLAPYLGRRCSIRLRCRGCRAAHVLNGTPRPGRYLGDFMLKGYAFPVEDIEQIWQHETPPRRPLLRRLGLPSALRLRPGAISAAPHGSVQQ